LSLSDRVSGGDATVEQVLTHRADPALLRRIVEIASGQDFHAYVTQNILDPLAGGTVISLPESTGRLLVALTTNGSFDGRQILAPEPAEMMTQPQFSIPPALPGWTYGFAELRRNNWGGAQWDGAWTATPLAQARMVIVPEARVAYFILVEGQADAS